MNAGSQCLAQPYPRHTSHLGTTSGIYGLLKGICQGPRTSKNTFNSIILESRAPRLLTRMLCFASKCSVSSSSLVLSFHTRSPEFLARRATKSRLRYSRRSSSTFRHATNSFVAMTLRWNPLSSLERCLRRRITDAADVALWKVAHRVRSATTGLARS